MTLYIKVVADTNDADYITYFGTVAHMDLKLINKVGAAIKSISPYEQNWPVGEYARGSIEDLYVATGKLTLEEIYYFDENYVPHGMDGIHSIESIQILDIVSIEDKV